MKQDPKINPYMVGRQSDKDLADQTFQDATKPYKDLVMESAQKQGISPAILFSSLNEEGVRDMVHNNEYSGDDNYPISGYAHFGLDTFGDAYPELVKKGYLPPDMNFSPQVATNEKGGRVHTANFKTVDDAIAAKAAMMRDVADQVDAYAQKRGYKLSDKSKQFFMLAGYNGGTGLAQKMMDSYNQKGVLQNDAYLTKKPLSYGGVYDNVMRRIVPAQMWATEIFEPQQTTQPPVDKGVPIRNIEGQVIAYNVNGKVMAAN